MPRMCGAAMLGTSMQAAGRCMDDYGTDPHGPRTYVLVCDSHTRRNHEKPYRKSSCAFVPTIVGLRMRGAGTYMSV